MMVDTSRDITSLQVSVVMPAYNAEETISVAIESVLNQTHQAFELIIVEDASTDHTLQIAVGYGKKDSRIRVLKNMGNFGVAISRNHGVEDARFDWIAFLDSDDMWEPTKIEKQISILSKNPLCSICYTGSSFVDEQGRALNYVLNVPSKISYKELLKQNLISCSSVLVEKEALLQHPMPTYPIIHEDLATWLQILKNGSFAIGINEPLLKYRISSTSKSANKLLAARMQWRTYRYSGITPVNAFPLFISYSVRNIRKYICIQRSSSVKRAQ